MDRLVSIIIRTKNEERWITQCLQAISNQEYRNFEIILVDNQSTDKTLERARQFPIKKIVACQRYRPGNALNRGIQEASGDYLVCLSAHCLPVNNQWLGNLLRNFSDNQVAGVYGRQEPMSFTPDEDKRDLAIVFGLDRKVQVKDSFFHNANSMIRRDLWEKIPFSDDISNIEDRLWAEEVLKRGYKIIYEPEASVYHYHGIHQSGNVERCTNVVRILESLGENYTGKPVEAQKLQIVALIPVRGPVQDLNGRPLTAYTILSAQRSKFIKRIIVSTDDSHQASIARELGAETPFLRDPSLSEETVDLGTVLKYSIEKIEEQKIFPDLVVTMEVTFPFRPKGLLDEMILQLSQTGLDSVVAGRRENRALWKERERRVIQLDEGLTPRQFKEPTFIELRGVGCVTHPEFLRKGQLLGQKIGIHEVNDPYSPLEVRSEEEFKMASVLIKSQVDSLTGVK